jgi:hypothetical protein
LNTVAYEDSNNNPPFSNNAALQVVPSFVDSTHYDFHQLSGSPTAGVGTTVTDTNWGTISNTNLGAFDGSFATPSIIGTNIPAGVTITGVTIH